MTDTTPTPDDNPNGPAARESFAENEQIAPEPDETETLGGAGPDPAQSASKDPEDWVTGDEPMTGPQKSYLDTLLREAGEELPATLTKAEASEHIDRLQKVTGRGQ